jgi:hypothetical protein
MLLRNSRSRAALAQIGLPADSRCLLVAFEGPEEGDGT